MLHVDLTWRLEYSFGDRGLRQLDGRVFYAVWKGIPASTANKLFPIACDGTHVRLPDYDTIGAMDRMLAARAEARLAKVGIPDVDHTAGEEQDIILVNVDAP